MMKKVIALLLAVVMLCSMVGCTEKPEILGTYQTEVKLYDLVVKTFDDGLGVADTNFSLKYYLEDFTILVTFEFLEDGTYSMTVEQDSIAAAVAQLKEAVLPLLTDHMFSTFKQQFAPYGFPIDTRSDLEAIVGMSWDDVFQSALGKSAEELVNELINDSFMTALTGNFRSEGRFIAKDGQLHISAALNAAPPEDCYETYEISGSTVTITGGVNLEENLFFSYPYVLKQIKAPAAAS